MNPLRGLMLLGSLGKVWSKTRFGRNVFSSISICAYFKLLSDYENGQNSNIVIVPTAPPPPEPKRRHPSELPRTTSSQRHRERLRQTMRNVNRIIYDN
jgi:hypothetical protein